MTVMGIDPGPEKSAFVVVARFYPLEIAHSGHVDNERLRELMLRCELGGPETFCIEDIRPYGILGRDVLETLKWVGRYAEIAQHLGLGFIYATRAEVAQALTGGNGNKSAVNLALREWLCPFVSNYGKGTLKNPGPLRHLGQHELDALAVAAYWWWMQGNRPKKGAPSEGHTA